MDLFILRFYTIRTMPADAVKKLAAIAESMMRTGRVFAGASPVDADYGIRTDYL